MDLINLVISILVLILIIAALIYLLLTNFVTVPFIPTRNKKVDRMILEADLKSDDIVFDLGSGDGRIIMAAAEAGVKKAIGFELNPFLNIFARICSFFLKLKNAEFITISFWKADLSKCDKLFVFLLNKTLAKLEEKVIDEMKPGSLIISNQFKFPNLKPIKILEKERIFIYRIEAKRD